MTREGILAEISAKPAADFSAALSRYLVANKHHDAEILAAAWPKVCEAPGSIVKDFLFYYALMEAAAGQALLGKLKELFAQFPVRPESLLWYEWWGKTLLSAFTGSHHAYDFIQSPLSREFGHLRSLAGQILALERFDGETDTHIIVAPWLKLLAAIDDVPDADRAELQQTILATLLESQRQEDYPVWHLTRFPGKRIDTLLACMTRCANVTKKEDVKFSLESGAHLGNLRGLVYLHALAIALIHQNVTQAELTEAVKALNWSDHKVFLLAVTCFTDIGFQLAGVRVDDDPPDWLATQPLVKPLLLALYKEGSSDDGQMKLSQLLIRMNFLTPEKPTIEIKKIPTEVKAAVKLMRELEPNLAKPAKEADLKKVAVKLGSPLPKDLKAFYKLVNGISAELVPVGQLPALHADFKKEIAALLEEGPEDENFSGDEIDIRTLLPLSNFFPIGELASGDYLFIHKKQKTSKGNVPVMRYCHDMSFVCKVEAESLGFFAARLVVASWAENTGQGKRLFPVLYPDIRLAGPAKRLRAISS